MSTYYQNPPMSFPRRIASYSISNILFIFFVCFFPTHLVPQLDSAWIQTQPVEPTDCPQILKQALQNQELIYELENPVYTNAQDIQESAKIYTPIEICIQKTPPDELTGELARLKALIEYFSIFLDPDYADTGLLKSEFVDLKTSTDPAVEMLRDTLGIPAPPGYVYVRYYPSRESMPIIIQEAFKNPQVVGVTIFSRYIAILNENQGSWAEKTLGIQTLPVTISHELVHAYINSYIAQKNSFSPAIFPTWFDEGLASYISHSDRPHTVITPSLTLNQTASEKYQYYTQIFNYLEYRLGKQQLWINIRTALDTGDAGELYRSLGIPDDRWLEVSVDAWQKQRVQRNFLFGVILIVGVVAGLSFALPEFDCECGYTGRRKNFRGGVCPDCGRPISIAKARTRIFSPERIIPSCELCHRRFWFWQREKMHIHPRLVRVWVRPTTGSTQPIPHHVHRVCENCLSISRQTIEEYQQSIDKIIAQKLTFYKPIYRDWLTAAPVFSYADSYLHKLPFETALKSILLAALEPSYGNWFEDPPPFEFANLDYLDRDEDGIITPPPQYLNVLVNLGTKKFGSVFQSRDGSVIILWE